MSTPFTIYVGNEVVADMHMTPPAAVRLYTPVPVEYHLGGTHVFNAAAIAAELKRRDLPGKVAMLGTISTDVFGQNLIDTFAALGIDTSRTIRVQESTLLAVVTHGETNNSFYFPNGKANAMLATTQDDLPELAPEDHKMLLMQGVCSAFKPSGAHWLAYANKNAASTLIVYDVNARPTLIEDMKAHRRLVADWAQTSSVIKISDADRDIVYPGKSIQKVGNGFLDKGTALVVETRGGASTRVVSRHGLQSFPIPKLSGLTNTVGAGDNFMAGLTLAFAEAGIFTTAQMVEISREDIAGFVQQAVTTAGDYLRRQNNLA